LGSKKIKNMLHCSKITTALFLGFAFISTSQTKNAEDSKYTFKKIYHLDNTPVESQGSAGTCWSFSALSFLESELMRLGKRKPSELSEMYIVRKAYELKADKFIRMDGKINFGEGGAFHDVPLVIKNFGIVPKDAYNTNFNEIKGYDHATLFKYINDYMQKLLAQVGTPKGLDLSWKEQYNQILDKYFGEDLQKFKWEEKTYSPKTYAESIGLVMDNYVSLTSFSNHPMHEKCLLEIPDNWAWGESYNVELEELFTTCESALKNGFTIAWGADVSEKGFSFKNGIALVPENSAAIEVEGKDEKNYNNAGANRVSNAFLTPTKELKITSEMRQFAYDNKTTTDDHGMHIVGMYIDQVGTKYFLVKNSWGTSNFPKGYLYVSEAYFKFKTINIYIHKDGIPSDLKTKLKL
jgi:bleomycin hydrolase